MNIISIILAFGVLTFAIYQIYLLIKKVRVLIKDKKDKTTNDNIDNTNTNNDKECDI